MRKKDEFLHFSFIGSFSIAFARVCGCSRSIVDNCVGECVCVCARNIENVKRTSTPLEKLDIDALFLFFFHRLPSVRQWMQRQRNRCWRFCKTDCAQAESRHDFSFLFRLMDPSRWPRCNWAQMCRNDPHAVERRVHDWNELCSVRRSWNVHYARAFHCIQCSSILFFSFVSSVVSR